MRYLETQDPLVAETMMAVANRHHKLRDELADEDAIRTALAVSRSIFGG